MVFDRRFGHRLNRTCQERSCNKEVLGYGGYCSDHKYSCQERGCLERVSSSRGCCQDHRRFCRKCSERIRYNRDYCSQHEDCCRIIDCSGKRKGGGEYCSEHYYKCRGDGSEGYSYCSERISSNGYCWRHLIKCRVPSCPQKLSYWDKYCYKHQNYDAIIIPDRVSSLASTEMQEMVREKLANGENEFECKIECPVYEKLRYNRGYIHYEKFER